jgi:diguanylate cyclase (GGDEF)-like protein/PAS domain S-box-containing protein
MKMEGFYRRLLDQLYDGVYFVDRDRRITYWNEAAERITGYGREDVVGSCCFHNILRHVDKAGRSLCSDGCPLHAVIADGRPREAEVYFHHKDGHRVPVNVRVVPMHDDEGRIVGASEIFSRKSARAEVERRISELRRRLSIDVLTQVPNRDHAERAIRSRLFDLHNGGPQFGLLFMDIDRFKSINDSHGHAIGDIALKTLASTLIGCVRPTDVVARWGGEEFVGAFDDVDTAGLDVVCRKILAVTRSSEVVDGATRVPLTISVGATLARASDSFETLVARADGLMYRSKNEGRDRATIG